MAYINHLQTLKAPYQHRQEDIIHFMQDFYQFNDVDLRKVKWLYRKSGINYRYSVLPDFTKTQKAQLFTPSSKDISLTARMDQFNAEAPKLGEQLIHSFSSAVLKDVTHLITITCTGLAAPGLELELLKHLEDNCSQRAINFMGCYAALHGTKQAHEICALHPEAKVLVIDIELCTLHFQYSTQSDLVNSAMIFGDGAAAWIVSNKQTPGSLKILGSFNKVLRSESDKMAWFPSETGFLMQLSSYIPDVIGSNIQSLINDAIKHYGLGDDFDYCVHPGGLRILDEIAKAMDLDPEAMQSSYTILEEYGNMSSPTVMYVLNHMQKMGKQTSGKKVMLIAFGPGLSIETVLLEYA